MTGKREFLYYHLLKYSDHGALDHAVDQLCSAPIVELPEVPLRLQLDSLVQTSQEIDVYSIPEIAQMCMEVRLAIDRKGHRGVTTMLLGRALEAVGVASATNNFRRKFKPYMDSRLYRTQGLDYLLSTYGDQVLMDMATDISVFEAMFVSRAQVLQKILKGLMALKRTHIDVYKIFTKRRKVQDCRTTKALRRGKTASLCLDESELKVEDVSLASKFLPGRRAFSLDVQAGLEVALPGLSV